MKKLFLLIAILALTVCSTAMAEDGPANNEIWYTSTDNSVVEPNNIDFNVGIVSNDYKDGKGVITFSGELTSIGEYAFSGNSKLTSITLPASVTNIGYSTFNAVTQINAITIPASVKSIDGYAFNGCTSLVTLTFAEGSQLETIGTNAFTNTGIYGELNYLPASLKTIGDYAFSNLVITAVTIPASVTSIGKNAFSACSGLKTLIFAEGSQLKTIGEGAFQETAISGELNYLPASLISIGGFAFNRVTITAVTIPASVKTIGWHAFSGCGSLETLTLAEGSQLETIGGNAFDGTAVSGELTLPASVTTIGKWAFCDCPLTKVYMSTETLSDISNSIFINSALIIVPAKLYEAYKSHFSGSNKVEVTSLSDWKEYAIAKIEAYMKIANTLSDTDRNTIAGYISTIENATTLDGTLYAYYAALNLIDQQKAFEEKVKGVLEEWGTKQAGPAIEIVGEDGKAIQLYKIKNVKFIKVNEEKE